MTTGDREHIRSYYDDLGEGEWSRLESTIRGRVSFQVHRRFLERFLQPGERVLEVGAGPGRFTIELARLEATVDVTDLSPVQLELHRQHIVGTPAEVSVRSRALLDICDTSRYDDDEYDVILAYGGPLSYAFENTAEALAGLFRITKPGGYVLASVMSLLGSWRYFFAAAAEETRAVGEDANDLVLTTGDLRHIQSGHICQMFRARDVRQLVNATGNVMVAISSSNWTSLSDPAVLEEIETEPDRWSRFLEHEIAACGEEGALDGGTHILFAAMKARP